MSLVKQTDVKNHVSPRRRSKIHLCHPEPARRNRLLGAEPDAVQADPSDFAEDFVAEHSSPSTVRAQGTPLTGFFSPETPAASKSVQP